VSGSANRPRVGIDLRQQFSRRQSAPWIVAALLAVAADMLLCYYVRDFAFSWQRAILPTIALLCYQHLQRKHGGRGWPQIPPDGGWRSWVKVSLIVTAWALLLWFLLFGVASLFDWYGPRFPTLDPAKLPPMLVSSCVLAPVLEEAVYRYLLCTALAMRFRHRTVVFISGTLFGLLHFTYGNLAPTNLLAGYLLSWAYLMSSSLWIPVVWHAVGNLGILLAQVILFQIRGA
jgi:membrane protease YdiL (CAAX protease family)